LEATVIYTGIIFKGVKLLHLIENGKWKVSWLWRFATGDRRLAICDSFRSPVANRKPLFRPRVRMFRPRVRMFRLRMRIFRLRMRMFRPRVRIFRPFPSETGSLNCCPAGLFRNAVKFRF
jgi:hypothetical protein